MTAHTGGDPDMCPGCRQLPARDVPAILCPGPSVIDDLNEIAARWEHGHTELTDNCSLCHAEWAEVHAALHGPATN